MAVISPKGAIVRDFSLRILFFPISFSKRIKILNSIVDADDRAVIAQKGDPGWQRNDGRIYGWYPIPLLVKMSPQGGASCLRQDGIFTHHCRTDKSYTPIFGSTQIEPFLLRRGLVTDCHETNWLFKSKLLFAINQ